MLNTLLTPTASMRLAAFSVLLVTSASLAGAAPVSFVKADNGWSKISSSDLLQKVIKDFVWRIDSEPWVDHGGKHRAVDSETDDEDEVWEPSGNDEPDHDHNREGVCIHRGTLHTIERGSVELHQSLCLLCVCQTSGLLHCIKTC